MAAQNPVRWFEIYVQDLARARKFYESVLQVKLDKLGNPDGTDASSSKDSPQPEMLAFPMDMEGTGSAGALVKMQGFPSGGNSVLVYFASDDCAVEAGRVKSAGGRIQQEKMSIGEHGFIALAVDTEGNMFGLHSMQ